MFCHQRTITLLTYTIMRQEEIQKEKNAGGGGGAAKPATESNGMMTYVKYIAFALIFAAMATGIILAVV